MQVLMIEIGNTNAKWCLTDGCSYFHIDHCFNTLPSITEKIGRLLKNVTPQHIVIASVLNQVFNKKIKKFIENASNKNVQLLDKARIYEKGFICSKYNPRESLGIDRYLSLVAANLIYPRTNLIVIDSGTATTIDLIMQDQIHYGGVILPGKYMLKYSITNNIDVLSELDLNGIEFDKSPLQTTTVSNIACGGYYSWMGGIKLVLHDLIKSLDGMYKLIITGGDGETLVESLEYDVIYEPLLVFKGMHYLYENTR